MFRGREMIHTEVGKDLMQKIVVATESSGIVEVPARMEGSNMTMTLAPAPAPKPGKAGQDKPDDPGQEGTES